MSEIITGRVEPLDRMSVGRLKNLQASARRRGFSLRRAADGFVMVGRTHGPQGPWVKGRMTFEDLNEVRDELGHYATA